MTTKKKYEKPTSKVVMLQQHSQLLAGSGESLLDAERQDYGTAEEQVWP